MAQPKKKTSKTRTGTRRSQIKLEMPSLVYCEKCHQLKKRHKICPTCGTYSGKEIIKTA
jgi:large subunit ribosomal protein L32